MEQEESWIRVIKRLNILPNIVTLCIFCIVSKKDHFWWRNEEMLYGLLSLISIIGYVLSYRAKFDNFRNKVNIWIWIIGLITATIWLILFSNLVFKFLDKTELFSILLSSFLVGYPLYMLYFNFRLYMNEIAKPI
jgi:hypothetical protein